MKKLIFIKTIVTLLFAMGSFISFSVFAQPPTHLNNVNLLYIQVAKHGELIPVKDKVNTYHLVLKQADPFTSYFSDRPNRITGLISTDQFINDWSHQNNPNPPNVAIETSDLKNGQRIYQVFELSHPVYDAKSQQITYVAKSLNKKPLQISNTLKIGYTVLFIDGFHWNGNKFG